MRAVTGLISLSGGELELFGKNGYANLQEARRKIGQSIESPALYPNATAEQNLEIQRIISNTSDKGNVKRILKLIGLDDTGRKKAKDFSLGMKQRLALALALISNPEFIILDEPINGLDPKGIIEIRELIRRLAHDQGITLLISSHFLDELSQIATHYGIIDKGRLIKQLSVEELAGESRRYIRIITDDPQRVSLLLQEHLHIHDFKIISQKELRLFEGLDTPGDINLFLVNQGIGVESINVKEQSLEEYFMNITEGTAS
jgi:ABC-2 type transport system ATP-binding protein